MEVRENGDLEGCEAIIAISDLGNNYLTINMKFNYKSCFIINIMQTKIHSAVLKHVTPHFKIAQRNFDFEK